MPKKHEQKDWTKMTTQEIKEYWDKVYKEVTIIIGCFFLYSFIVLFVTTTFFPEHAESYAKLGIVFGAVPVFIYEILS